MPERSCCVAGRCASAPRATPSSTASAWCRSPSCWGAGTPWGGTSRRGGGAPPPPPPSPARQVQRRVEELGDRYGLVVAPRAPIWSLSVSEQQRVEILKALLRGAEILILDEPTSVLTPQEALNLFAGLRGGEAEGHA